MGRGGGVKWKSRNKKNEKSCADGVTVIRRRMEWKGHAEEDLWDGERQGKKTMMERTKINTEKKGKYKKHGQV